jgi:Transposase DDE domain
MGIPSDRRFLAVARKRLRELSPSCPSSSASTSEEPAWPRRSSGSSASLPPSPPGFHDDVLLIDSTPLECARSVETTRRSALADAADYGWCGSHSRFFWGFRLHGLFAPDGTPKAFALASPKRDEREVGVELLKRASRSGGEVLTGDKGYAGREFAAAVDELDATIVRPARRNESDNGIHLAPIRQRIESIFWTCKDILTLERHGARTLHNLRARIAQRFLALAACVALNHRLGRPSRALVDYVA